MACANSTRRPSSSTKDSLLHLAMWHASAHAMILQSKPVAVTPSWNDTFATLPRTNAGSLRWNQVSCQAFLTNFHSVAMTISASFSKSSYIVFNMCIWEPCIHLFNIPTLQKGRHRSRWLEDACEDLVNPVIHSPKLTARPWNMVVGSHGPSLLGLSFLAVAFTLMWVVIPLMFPNVPQSSLGILRLPQLPPP